MILSNEPLRLGAALAPEALRKIRRTLELRHHKWDAQVGDVVALAATPLVITSAAWAELSVWAEALFAETRAVEEALVQRPDLQRELGLPQALRKQFQTGRALTPAAARSMRFDFHYTSAGWQLSEVNSDVPGGYTEATHFAQLVAAEVPGTEPAGDPTAALVDALAESADGGPVALFCAGGFMEDQQVVSHLAAALRARGVPAELASLQQLLWSDGRAWLRVGSRPAREIGAVFRFFQAEWLASLPLASWRQLFVDGRTPCANPGLAALSESKRLPLVWDRLGTSVPTWRRLLPETRELRDAPWTTDEGWLIKSAYSNNGDTVSIRSALTRRDWLRRKWRARLHAAEWLAQRRFSVLPLHDAGGALLPCVGVYVINGKVAGAYARVTRGTHIDFAALDAALLIETQG